MKRKAEPEHRCVRPSGAGPVSGPIDQIVFDLGGVVLRWRPDEVLRREVPSEVQRTVLRGAMFGHSDWLELDRGAIDEGEAARRFAARTGIDAARIRQLIEAARASLSVDEETLCLMRSLKALGVGIYCLSNLSPQTWDDLRHRFDFWSLFDGMVLSCHVGQVKPEPGIYLHLLQRFGLDPRRTVFFDDLEHNVQAARNQGIHAFVFDDAESARRLLQQRFGLTKPN